VLIAEQSKTWTVDGVVARMRNRITCVASESGEVVGTAGFDRQQARRVFVRPDRHGLGIGSLLMRTIETVAAERGLSRLSLLSSITAQGFYERLGYRAVRDVFHGAERTILMEKELSVEGDQPSLTSACLLDQTDFREQPLATCACCPVRSPSSRDHFPARSSSAFRYRRDGVVRWPMSLSRLRQSQQSQAAVIQTNYANSETA
jgi:predicted GNAT family N-acyltransferase